MVISVRNLLLLVGLGLVAGMSARSVHAQIPPGYEVIRLTDDPDRDGAPSINNLGHVVWSKQIDQDFAAEEIFLWDGVQVRRLTNDTVRDAFPDINDYGTIVWSRRVGPGDTMEIVRLQGREIEILTNDEFSDWAPEVNNLGHIAWNNINGGGCAGFADVFFFDGESVRQITDPVPGLLDQGVEINDHDELAWTRFDFCQNPWMGTIMLYSNGEVIELSDGMSQDQFATINTQGDVAWGNGYPDPNGVFLWTGEETREVTNWGRAPRLNCRGDIAFIRFHDDIGAFQQWLWNGAEFLRLSNDSQTNGGGVINDCAEVAWESGVLPERDVLLMRMIPGDGNHDGTVDVNDVGQLRGCFTGPRLGKRSCLGPDTDVDRDGDVDLQDFTVLQERFGDLEKLISLLSCMTGPLSPKDDCACRAMDMDFDRDTDLRDFAMFQASFSKAP